MRIISLHAEGFKRIKVVDIKPTSRLVQITGKNGHGKTSCLDAILVAIQGMAAFRGQSEPINLDAKRAMIKLDLGDMVVTRVFNRPKEGAKNQEVTTEVRVENKDGFRAPEPQRMLDTLIAPLTLDPLEFSRMAPREQRDSMRALVTGFDFEANAKARKDAFDLRTGVNRQAKEADAMAASVKLPDDIATDQEPVDEAALTQQLAEAGEVNADLERRRTKRVQVADRITALDQSATDKSDGLPAEVAKVDARHDEIAADIAAQIEALQKRAQAVEAARENAQREIRDTVTREIEEIKAEAGRLREALVAAAPLAEPVDVQAVMVSIADARRINASLRVRDDRLAKEDRAKALHADADAITARITALDLEKTTAIAAAKLPVPGLTIGDDEILLDGLPFSQASDAQRLRTSCAIAMALNPQLRVLRVRDGSLLDEDGLKLLEEMAVENDFDIWLESVSSDGKTGFVLENGYIKGMAPADEAKQGALV